MHIDSLEYLKLIFINNKINNHLVWKLKKHLSAVKIARVI